MTCPDTSARKGIAIKLIKCGDLCPYIVSMQPLGCYVAEAAHAPPTNSTWSRCSAFFFFFKVVVVLKVEFWNLERFKLDYIEETVAKEERKKGKSLFHPSGLEASISQTAATVKNNHIYLVLHTPLDWQHLLRKSLLSTPILPITNQVQFHSSNTTL